MWDYKQAIQSMVITIVFANVNLLIEASSIMDCRDDIVFHDLEYTGVLLSFKTLLRQQLACL